MSPVPASWAETQQALEQAELFWITTVRADGAIHFATGPQEQKAVNLRANPHVVLTTGCNQWDTGLDVVVEGEAVRVTDEDTLKRLAQAWTTEWDGRWQFNVTDGAFHDHGESYVFSVRPAQVFAHAKGHFGQTRHRFS